MTAKKGNDKSKGEKQIPFGNDRKKSNDKSKGEKQIPFGNDRRKSKNRIGSFEGLTIAEGLRIALESHGCVGMWLADGGLTGVDGVGV